MLKRESQALSEAAATVKESSLLAWRMAVAKVLLPIVDEAIIREARRQVSTDGGSQPQWSHDGSDLFYMGRNRTLMSVPFQSRTTTFDAGIARALFATRTRVLEVQRTSRSYSAARDGQRFLVANATEESHSAAITVVLNKLATLPR